MDDKHFDKVFFFIAILVGSVVLFDGLVIFIPVPKGGEKYADILLGSLNTGALMSCINYLLGGGPDKKKTEGNPTINGDNPVVNVATDGK